MPSVLGIDTAIGWAHWNLRGGWKKTLIFCACFIVAISGLMTLSIQLREPRPGSEQAIWAAWRAGLMVLQSGVLVLFTASRVAVAIRSDITSRMVESHQLMPVPALSAVSGYLWGPTALSIFLALTNVLLGLYATVAAGMDVRTWLIPNLILFTFAIFSWVLAAFSAFLSRSAWAGVFGLLLACGMSQGAAMLILPGIGLLASPVIGTTIFYTRARSFEFEWTTAISLVGQFLTGTIFYIGAARKYRNNDESALGVVPAMLLLVLWTALSMVGIIWNEDFRNPMFRDPDSFLAQLVASTIFLMMVALAPIANAARDRRLTHYSPLIAILCAAIILSLPLAALRNHNVAEVGLVTCTLLAGLVCLCYLLRIAYRTAKQGWVIAVCWIGIAWSAPLIIDLIIWTVRHPKADFEMGTLSSASPLGALIMIWNNNAHSAIAGVLVQLLLAIFWMALFHGTRRQNHVRAVDQAG